MSNVRALRTTLRELKRMGRLEPIDAAKVQALKSMAGALDADPANAALWRQYQEALKGLTADDGDDSVDQALEELFGSTSVRDTPPA